MYKSRIEIIEKLIGVLKLDSDENGYGLSVFMFNMRKSNKLYKCLGVSPNACSFYFGAPPSNKCLIWETKSK